MAVLGFWAGCFFVNIGHCNPVSTYLFSLVVDNHSNSNYKLQYLSIPKIVTRLNRDAAEPSPILFEPKVGVSPFSKFRERAWYHWLRVISPSQKAKPNGIADLAASSAFAAAVHSSL
jgi:hypothetical protein